MHRPSSNKINNKIQLRNKFSSQLTQQSLIKKTKVLNTQAALTNQIQHLAQEIDIGFQKSTEPDQTKSRIVLFILLMRKCNLQNKEMKNRV